LQQSKSNAVRLSQKITGFLHNGVSTLWYFAVMAVKENFRNYVGRAGRTEGALSDELALLANGPSLADELPRLLAGARAGCDFLAVNYFAEHEAFERLRPAYYVLSDPQFFRASAQRDRVAALYRHARAQGDMAHDALRAVLQSRTVRLPRRAAQRTHPHRALPHAALPRFPEVGVLALPPRAGKRQFRHGDPARRVRRAVAGLPHAVSLTASTTRSPKG